MKLGFIALGCLLIAAPAAAQEKQDGKAVQVELIKFKAGTIDRVDEIESKYFDPAARKIGFSPVVIRFQTGPWDREYIFPMTGGMADLDYKATKDQIAWLAEVDRLAGGPGSAKKLLAEFDAAIERSTTDVGFSSQR
ncbi:hypothetical protein ACLB0R_11190 [Sphingomonas sp. GlSt437]